MALQRAGSIDPLTGVAASRATSVLIFLVLLLLSRTSAPARALPAVAVVGLLDTAATLAYTLASSQTLLSVTAVLASLYPLVTVALAHTLLHERLSRGQWTGTGMAAAGVLLIVSG